MRHGVDGDRHGEHERPVLIGCDLDSVGVTDPEPLLGDLGDLAVVGLDLVLVVDDVALHLPLLVAGQVHLPPLAQRRDERLVDQGEAFAVGVLDGHRVADVEDPGLDPADLVAVGVLEVERVPKAHRLPVDAEYTVTGVVLDPVVIADGDQLLSHLVLVGGAATSEGLAFVSALLAPVSQAHLLLLFVG